MEIWGHSRSLRICLIFTVYTNLTKVNTTAKNTLDHAYTPLSPGWSNTMRKGR